MRAAVVKCAGREGISRDGVLDEEDVKQKVDEKRM